ncbi:hypothetical protein ABPG75_007938 [Micractinium tetrahymenae]
MAQEVFAEHLGVISALRENYMRTEDAVAVTGLVRAQQEVAAACSAREQQVKEVIKELTSKVRHAEQAAAYPREEDAHAEQVVALETARAEAQENVDGMNQRLQELQAQRTQLKGQVAALQAKADHIEEIVTQAEPHTRHQLSLYAHVSKITWQFDRPARMAGTVSTPSQLRPFDFDPAATPDFDIVNQLWEMMGTED